MTVTVITPIIKAQIVQAARESHRRLDLLRALEEAKTVAEIQAVLDGIATE